jgi:hypothetical protein
LDVVVTRRHGSAVRVYLNKKDGTGGLNTGVDYATGSGPHWLVLKDLDGDGDLDIATANYDASNVSILYNNGNGTYAAAVNVAMTGRPHGIAAGDLNGDGRVDLAVAAYEGQAVKLLLRQADGTYAAGEVFAWSGNNGEAVAIGDVNGDNRDDLFAVQENGTQVRRWYQQAGGVLQEQTPISLGANRYNYVVRLADVTGDGKPDLQVGINGYVLLYENRGAGVFDNYNYVDLNASTFGVVTGDFNGDGRGDVASTTEGRHMVKVFLGRGVEVLPADGSGFLGKGRGNVSSTSDNDYFSFSAKAGDRVFVTTENPGQPPSSGLLYYVYRPEGSEMFYFYTNDRGTGQGQFVAPVTGVYFVRVRYNYQYFGEYRLAVSVQAGTYDLESEDNNNQNQPNGLNWTQTAGARTAAVGGVLTLGDPGDWFSLGYLDEGTQVTLNASKHTPNALSWILDIRNSSGGLVIEAPVNEPTLQYTIPTGASGTYHARIRTSSGADMFARYVLNLTLADVDKPEVTASTLPAEGSTLSTFFGDFSLSFSEILQAATVNNAANYDFRSAGPDGLFDTADDIPYAVALASAYSSGLSASYRIADGPPQPGKYRFQAKTGLLDLYGNGLASVYARTFTVVGVEGYVFESRSNDTFGTATTLAASGAVGAAFGGSWHDGVEYAAGGNYARGLAVGDLDGDGKLDLVTANWSSDTVSVLLGNGNGTFKAAVTSAAPNTPFQVVVGDVNGDGALDVVVTRRHGSAVRVYLNKKDGTGGLNTGCSASRYFRPILSR